jgi:hypothetical protein
MRGKIELSSDFSLGATRLSGKAMKGWFRAVFSIVFYLGLFSGIGYLIELALF